MKAALMVCMLFGLNVVIIESESFYVATAPNVIRFDHDEEMVISIFDDINVLFEIWLEHKGNIFSKKTVVVKDEETPATVTFKVKENDIIQPDQEKPRKLTLVVNSLKYGKSKSDVVLSYRTGYFIIQTDKPIYTPMQEVNVRALALNENLKISPDTWQVGMDIVSPSDQTMGRIVPKYSPSGFYKHKFTLPPYPEIGIWTVRAFYQGQLETETRTRFEVKEYVLPTFGVTIDVSKPFLLIDSANINVTVTAEYVYGKRVQGISRLKLYLTNPGKGAEEYIKEWIKPLRNGVSDFTVEHKDIKNNNTSLLQEGSRFKVVATVTESVTGKEEATFHDGTVIAAYPHKFDFTRSKKTYRPGWEYTLKVDITYPNGQAAEKVNVTLIMMWDNIKKEVHVQTNVKGQAIAMFTTADKGKTIRFQVKAPLMHTSQLHTSQIHTVEPHIGKNQLQVEQLIRDDNTMWMRATSNRAGAQKYTGMIFMVITRGKIVFKKFEQGANAARVQISEELQEMVSPGGRLLTFYIDKQNRELVADSEKFNVEAKCRGNVIKIRQQANTIEPGKPSFLSISGEPYTWVGTSAIDKALLLLNSKNILTKSTVFEALESHDLGCGMGGGQNVEEVFKETGLTVMTNAVLTSNLLTRNSETCLSNKRHKRNTNGTGCYLNVNKICCEKGREFAEDTFSEAAEKATLDAHGKCYAKARILVTERKNLPTVCIMAFFHSCRAELESLIEEMSPPQVSSKSLLSDGYFENDLKHLRESGITPRTRSDFRESWLFEEGQLDEKGEMEKRFNYPDSITTWMIQAIGITPDKGMCIAEPVEVKVFRDFFIQLELPYKAVRMEQFDVKATIFNYAMEGENKIANIYLEGQHPLCYNNNPDSVSQRIQLSLNASSAETVRFPIIPLEAGKFPITVTAIVTNTGIAVVDKIRKELLVVNEGIDEIVTIQVCLDPNKQMEDCENTPQKRVPDPVYQVENAEEIITIDLTLPADSIPGTGSAAAYIQSNIMDDVVKTLLNGVGNLLRMPSGCGEQTMLGLAPTVYAMMYLKQTQQITEAIEVEGNKYIRNGVNSEISQYRHPDGSYSAWQGRASSTWLTAFVAKVFCQAKGIVDDAIKDADLIPTINWLINNIQPNGAFVDNMMVIHREMIGQVTERDPSLTAFVLISLLECHIRTEKVNNTVSKAMRYLENLPEPMLKSNPYLLAISTYALAMAKSTKKMTFKNMLDSVKKLDGKMNFWGEPGGTPANAHSIETTAYALLASMQHDDFKTSANIVRWLTTQRSSSGSFRTTQDTVVGLQALSIYNVKTYTVDVDLKVTFLAKDWKSPKHERLTKENSLVQKIITGLPVEKGDNTLKVQVQGKGSGRMTIDLHYNRKYKPNEVCHFNLSVVAVENVEEGIDVNLTEGRNCNICGQCDDPKGNAAVYDFGADLAEPQPKINSNFGRKKRSADGRGPATLTKRCIKFDVGPTTIGKGSSMSIVNFGLETGMKVVEDDLKSLMKQNPNIARYEMPDNGKGFIIFYLNQINSSKTEFIFRLIDLGDVIGNRQPASVTVYDYYNPNKKCITLYGTGINIGNTVEAQCDKKEKNCQCKQSVCAQPVDDEILNLVNAKKRPAVILQEYACNPEKANYAVIANVINAEFDANTSQKIVTAKVELEIHQGHQKLEIDDEITFVWRAHCPYPDLQKNKSYLFIGKDANKIEKASGSFDYLYSLMGTAKVIERNHKEQVINTVVQRFITLMKTQGCMN